MQKIKNTKKMKVHQYNCTYLKFGFTTAPHNATCLMCLVWGSIFSNEAMKQSQLLDHLNKMNPNKIGSDFKKLQDDKAKQTTIFTLFLDRLISDRNMA